MKKTLRENYSVTVEPNESHYLRDKEFEDDKRRTCESIVDDIKRHVDEVQSASVVWDSRDVCSLCNREWEVWEDEPEVINGVKYIKNEPVCCSDASKEFRALFAKGKRLGLIFIGTTLIEQRRKEDKIIYYFNDPETRGTIGTFDLKELKSKRDESRATFKKEKIN